MHMAHMDVLRRPAQRALDASALYDGGMEELNSTISFAFYTMHGG